MKVRQAIKLCPLDSTVPDSAREFVVETNQGRRYLFAVRQENSIHVYENKCPHTGVNLDWTPDQFLNSTNDLIQCSTHGALFRIKDG